MKAFVFDTETTGLEPGSRAVELAAIAFDTDDPDFGAEFVTLINPGMPIPRDVSSIHGITDAMVADAPTTERALAAFVAWVAATGTDTTIAHNAPYDIGIVTWDAARCGIALPSLRFIDTVDIAKQRRATRNNRLVTLIDHHGIERRGDAHRALSDADACMKYFLIHHADGVPAPQPWTCDHTYTAVLPEALGALPTMVAAGAQLPIVYEDDKGERTERVITPYGWAQKSGQVLVHGWCRLRAQRRTFRADRITLAPQAEETA